MFFDPLEINGTQPALEGHVCEELLAEENWYGGTLTAPANVMHLRFSGAWHRLYFDCGTVFWRPSEKRPVPYPMPELDGEVRIIDLGSLYDVRGARLESIETSAIDGGSQVAFHFAGPRRVCFRDVHDVTYHGA